MKESLEARVAQLAERSIRNAKVGSSILPAGSCSSRIRRKTSAEVAQLAERGIRNAKVGGSIPPFGLKPSFFEGGFFIFFGGRRVHFEFAYNSSVPRGALEREFIRVFLSTRVLQ